MADAGNPSLNPNSKSGFSSMIKSLTSNAGSQVKQAAGNSLGNMGGVGELVNKYQQLMRVLSTIHKLFTGVATTAGLISGAITAGGGALLIVSFIILVAVLFSSFTGSEDPLGSKYATITKSIKVNGRTDASRLDFDNDIYAALSDEQKLIEYTISIKPKGPYELSLNNIQDLYQIIGDDYNQPTQVLPCEPNEDGETVPISQGSEYTCTYTLDPVTQVGNLFNAAIINSVVATFTVRDTETGEEIQSGASDQAVLRVGTVALPGDKCWPVTGQLSNSAGSHHNTMGVTIDGRWIPDTGEAIDVGAQSGNPIAGKPVYSATSGTAYAGDEFTGTSCFDNRSYGNCVRVVDINGSALMYAHLQEITIPNNITISRGTQIGTVGDTGTGARRKNPNDHLHWERYKEATLLPIYDFLPEPFVLGKNVFENCSVSN